MNVVLNYVDKINLTYKKDTKPVDRQLWPIQNHQTVIDVISVSTFDVFYSILHVTKRSFNQLCLNYRLTLTLIIGRSF